MWRPIPVLASLALFAATSSFARADTLPTVTSFTATGPAAAKFVGLAPFDPAQGTLDSIGVSIQFTNVVTFKRPFALDPSGGFRSQATTYRMEHDFDRVLNRFFGFSSPGWWQFGDSGPADGSTLSIGRTITYTFTVNATTDLTGNIFPTASGVDAPPTSAFGQRADFLLDPFVSTYEVLFRHQGTAFGPGQFVNLTSGGTIRMDYNFTSHSIPEPGSVLLVALGGWALLRAGTRRRR